MLNYKRRNYNPWRDSTYVCFWSRRYGAQFPSRSNLSVASDSPAPL